MIDERAIPICAECAHLVGKRTYTEQAAEWKCGKSSASRDSVTGVLMYEQTCYVARAEGGLCGLTGTLFEKYERPEPPVSPARGKQLPSADDLLGELGQ